jgi:phytoene synthase
VADFRIRPDHLHAVIEGCQTDLQQTRFLDYPALQRYCHLVAGVVGEVAANIFGSTQAKPRCSTPMGWARPCNSPTSSATSATTPDVGRIYLPLSELQRFDVKAHELLRRESPWGYSPRFEALMRFQAERAHATFDAALARLPASDRQAQKPGLMMANIYRTLLREIESQGFQVLHQRTSLTPLRKLWIATRTHVLAR